MVEDWYYPDLTPEEKEKQKQAELQREEIQKKNDAATDIIFKRNKELLDTVSKKS